MDPTATAQFIIDALKEGDIPTAAMAMEDLENWLKKGGFPPQPNVLAKLLREIMNSWSQLHRR